jgi:hypothetical protein
MEATMLRELVEIQSAPASLPSAPAKAVPRIYPGVPQRDNSIELQRLSMPSRSLVTSLPTTPRDEIEDLEMSRPASPALPTGGVEALPGIWDPYMNRFRFLSSCLMVFASGLNDSAPGALIPYMEKYIRTMTTYNLIQRS